MSNELNYVCTEEINIKRSRGNGTKEAPSATLKASERWSRFELVISYGQYFRHFVVFLQSLSSFDMIGLTASLEVTVVS